MYFQVTWHRLFSPCKQTSKNTSASAHQHKHLQQHIESDFYIWLPCNLLISTCCLINYYFILFFLKSIKNLCLGNCFYFYFIFSFQTGSWVLVVECCFLFFFFSLCICCRYLYFLSVYLVLHKRGSFAKVKENILS